MAVSTGTKFGPYQIEGPLGAGGMGEVYRARDTRLDRTVAVKVLPTHLSSNPDLRQRFDREARAISSLQHPHICTLHDVGHQNGVDYLVMEYLDGETLADRLTKGALPPEQVLKLGIELADALEKAHRAGVVHRDLKPGNVMLTKGGAKLLDFGLARAAQQNSASDAGWNAPVATVTAGKPLTQEGTIVGTYQYMAPEQIEGGQADARTDIFALGALLYEASTGRMAFLGKSQASVMAAILGTEPPAMASLQPLTPPGLERVVRACLAKNPEERIQTAHDAKRELQWALDAQAEAPATRKRRAVPAWTVVAAASVLVAAAVLLSLGYIQRSPGSAGAVRATLQAPSKTTFSVDLDDIAGPAVVSPDGTRIVFVANDDRGGRALWLHALNEDGAQRLPETDNATYPFWSPDSKWIGFFADGKVKRFALPSGPTLVLADGVRARGGAWFPNGTIVYAPNTAGPLFAVAATGGTPKQVTKLLPEHTTNRWPVPLPDGKHFLYFATSHANPDASDKNGIYIGSLDGASPRFVIPANSNAVFAAGHLLSWQNGTLVAQRFDPASGTVSGDPVAIAHDVQRNGGTWRAGFSASSNGVLTFHPLAGGAADQLVMADIAGKTTAVGTPLNYHELRVSPDGKRAAVQIGEFTPNLWVMDLARGVETRLAFGPASLGSAWSPDGKHIAYSHPQTEGEDLELAIMAADGSGSERVVTSGGSPKIISDWSPDGRYLLYTASSGTVHPGVVVPLSTTGSLWYVSVDGGKPQQLLPATAVEGRFSPDGRWVAYISSESGPTQVYVTTFPQASGKWQISAGGGRQPVWRRDGKALFYEAPDGNLMETEVTASGNSLQVGATQRLFRPSLFPVRWGSAYDVMPDGKHFLINSYSGSESRTLNLVVNWTAELKK